METKEIKQCVYCDNELTKENRSKEHVIPKWLLEFLKIRNTKIQPTHYSPEFNAISIRNHTLDGLVTGQICKFCNNGWMSQLEDEAMSILKPLIICNRAVVDLNDKERQIIGRWTIKTAFNLNSASNYIYNIPAEHFKYVKSNCITLPPKVYSFGQQHHGKDSFFWIQGSIWEIIEGSEKLKIINEFHKYSFKIAFQFGKLLLLIAYFPVDVVHPVLWRGIHIPLIPKSGKCGWYDEDEFPWDDSIKALTAFHIGLKAIIVE